MQCKAVHRKLFNLGVPYVTVHLEEADESVMASLAESGFLQAPVIELPDGTRYAGFRPDILDEYAATLQ